MATEEFNLEDLVREITGEADTSTNTEVRIADGEASQVKSKSGLVA